MPDRLSKRHLMANRTVLNRNGNFDLLPKPNFLLWKIPNILPKTKLSVEDRSFGLAPNLL